MAMACIEAHKQWKKGKITWPEYIHHLSARCRSVEHKDDEIDPPHTKLEETDAFAYNIWRWNASGVDIIKDTSAMEDVLVTYRDGTLDDIKGRLAMLSDEQKKIVLESLAFLALRERRADVLKYCLDQGGFPYEHYFEEEANRVKKDKDPETHGVIAQSEFRQLYPKKPRRGQRRPAKKDAASSTDHGSNFVNW